MGTSGVEIRNPKFEAPNKFEILNPKPFRISDLVLRVCLELRISNLEFLFSTAFLHFNITSISSAAKKLFKANTSAIREYSQNPEEKARSKAPQVAAIVLFSPWLRVSFEIREEIKDQRSKIKGTNQKPKNFLNFDLCF